MPANTREIFQKLASQRFIAGYILFGGAVLAIQIRYRLSEVLDFIFDGEKLNAICLTRNINLYNRN